MTFEEMKLLIGDRNFSTLNKNLGDPGLYMPGYQGNLDYETVKGLVGNNPNLLNGQTLDDLFQYGQIVTGGNEEMGFQYGEGWSPTEALSQWGKDNLTGYRMERRGVDGMKDGRTNAIYDPQGNLAYASNPYSYDPAGDTWKSVTEAAALSAAMFGGLGLAGYGPMAGMFGAGGGAMGGLDAVAAAEAGAGGLSAAGGAGAAGMGGLDAVAAFEAGTGGLSAGGAGAAGISSLPANLGNFSAMAPETLTTGLSSSAASIPSFTQGASLAGGAGGIGSYLTGGGGLSLAGNLLGGYMQSRASGKASDALLQAGRESNALLKGMYDQTRADFAPYREAGYSALGQIQNLLKDPSAITQQADYKFGLDQGRNNLENSASARGMTYSGAQAKALQQYGQDYAGSKLNESYNRLANIAGIGQTATNSTSTAGMNYGNQAGNTLQNMGNARASGYVGQGNAWNNAFGSIINDYNDWDARKGRGG